MLIKQDPTAAFFFSVGVQTLAGVAFVGLIIVIPIALVGFIVWLMWKYSRRPKPGLPVADLYEGALSQFRDLPSVEAATNDFANAFIDRHVGNWPVMSLSGAFVDAATELYKLENFGHLPPPPVSTEPIDLARYRELAHNKLKQAEHIKDFSQTLQDGFFSFQS